MRKPLEDLAATDAQGRSEVSLRLPAIPRTARPLEADVLLRLREPGGRAIERKVSMVVAPAEARVGVKPLFAGNEVGEGETAAFDVALVAPDGKAAGTASFKWELLRLDQRWQWYSRDGQWNYETVTTTRRIGGGTVNATSGAPARIAAQVDWGRYRLEVSAVGSTAATSSVTFNSGWHASDNLDSPEMLDSRARQAELQGGRDGARQDRQQAGGQGHDRRAEQQAARHPTGRHSGGWRRDCLASAARDWLPGAYVTATLYRPLDEKARRMPGRAIGVKWLGVDTAERDAQGRARRAAEGEAVEPR